MHVQGCRLCPLMYIMCVNSSLLGVVLPSPSVRDPVSMTIQEVVGSSDFTYPYSLLTVDASDNDGDSITYSLSDTTSDVRAV